MSRTIKLVTVLGVIAVVAACARKEPEYVVAEPISEEPVFTGKYK